MAGENEVAGYRPCVVLAHADAVYAADAACRLRRLGWDVYRADAGPEVRRLARMLEPEVIVLDAELDDESGWLTCAKLTGERPGSTVVMVGEPSPRNREMARFVGARVLVRREENVAAVVAQTPPPSASAG
jgi:DNA-binding response OmpR family regulator